MKSLFAGGVAALAAAHDFRVIVGHAQKDRGVFGHRAAAGRSLNRVFDFVEDRNPAAGNVFRSIGELIERAALVGEGFRGPEESYVARRFRDVEIGFRLLRVPGGIESRRRTECLLREFRLARGDDLRRRDDALRQKFRRRVGVAIGNRLVGGFLRGFESELILLGDFRGTEKARRSRFIRGAGAGIVELALQVAHRSRELVSRHLCRIGFHHRERRAFLRGFSLIELSFRVLLISFALRLRIGEHLFMLAEFVLEVLNFPRRFLRSLEAGGDVLGTNPESQQFRRDRLPGGIHVRYIGFGIVRGLAQWFDDLVGIVVFLVLEIELIFGKLLQSLLIDELLLAHAVHFGRVHAGADQRVVIAFVVKAGDFPAVVLLQKLRAELVRVLSVLQVELLLLQLHLLSLGLLRLLLQRARSQLLPLLHFLR